MAVMIHPDGSKEEFIFNRNAMSISRFNPAKIINQEETPFTKGDGKVSQVCELEFQTSSIHVYAWEKGDEKVINRYDYFPPPIDNEMFYGTIFVFRSNRRTKQVESITEDLFDNYIRVIHRGFEDLGSDDSDDESEEEEMPNQDDIDFIDNRTYDEIQDSASIADDESTASEGETDSEEEGDAEEEDDAGEEEGEGEDKAEPEAPEEAEAPVKETAEIVVEKSAEQVEVPVEETKEESFE